MLKQYKQQYISNNIQFIFTDYDGIILESDHTFLQINIGGSISKIHPFFECFSSIKEDQEKQITFNCVHLAIGNQEFATDIKMIKEEEGILIIIYDLTEHYISYQTIAQSRNESIINGELIVLKNIELEERERFKNSFIQNFSHELRNPLTSIISITSIIGDTEMTNEQKRMIDFLKDSNSNLKLMLEDILSISMIASGKLQIRDKVFNLFQLLELLEFTYKTKSKQKGLDFNLISDAKLPEYVEGDRLRIFQVLTNLLDNAFKYTEEGTILFEVMLNQKRANKVSLRFQVTDTGIGIPKESIITVFESFSQLDTPEKQNGTGLGLSIVKGLLEHMNSKIELRSSLNQGSVFYFDIVLKYPLHPTKDVKFSKVDKKIVKAAKVKKEGKYKILLVEDDERLQTLLFKSLIDTDFFYIDLVNDGSKVMEEVINSDYDLILMDVNLPNISGDQITRTIRDFPFKNIKNIPIIGLTAYAFENNIKDYIASGMNTVLSKPFDHDILLETMFKFLK